MEERPEPRRAWHDTAPPTLAQRCCCSASSPASLGQREGPLPRLSGLAPGTHAVVTLSVGHCHAAHIGRPLKSVQKRVPGLQDAAAQRQEMQPLLFSSGPGFPSLSACLPAGEGYGRRVSGVLPVEGIPEGSAPQGLVRSKAYQEQEGASEHPPTHTRAQHSHPGAPPGQRAQPFQPCSVDKEAPARPHQHPGRTAWLCARSTGQTSDRA